jgi:hypothetical protein
MFGTVNAHRGYFEIGIADFAKAKATWPGWLSRLLTQPVRGLDNYEELFRMLSEAKKTIKIYMIVSEE